MVYKDTIPSFTATEGINSDTLVVEMFKKGYRICCEECGRNLYRHFFDVYEKLLGLTGDGEAARKITERGFKKALQSLEDDIPISDTGREFLFRDEYPSPLREALNREYFGWLIEDSLRDMGKVQLAGIFGEETANEVIKMAAAKIEKKIDDCEWIPPNYKELASDTLDVVFMDYLVRGLAPADVAYLYDSYSGEIREMAENEVGDNHAEDMVQSVFETALDFMKKGRYGVVMKEPFEFLKSALNICITEHRVRKELREDSEEIYMEESGFRTNK